jgi:hypothetical protein
MIISTLFDPLSVLVLLAVIAMAVSAAVWLRRGQQAFDQLSGALKVLRRVAGELAAEHPIRKRLELAPVVDLSFEEITRLLSGRPSEPAMRALIRLGERIAWIERFAQFAVHLGILGTVFALVSSDPTDLEGFRARLPTALGTTFWGLIGALLLSGLAGACESLIERAHHLVRVALVEGFEGLTEGGETITSDGVHD